MERKKNNSATNENLRFSLALMGFLFVGGLALASFTYKTTTEKNPIAITSTGKSEIVYQSQTETPDVSQTEKIKFTPPPAVKIIITPPDPTPPAPVVTPPLPPPVVVGPVIVAPTPPEIIDFPDVEARFPGGAAALQKWISNNVEYPETSIIMEDQGRVTLSFVVEPNGAITNIKIIKKVTKELDREAKRVTRKMPNWIPGEVQGKKVRTRCSLPVVFTLY
jgi:protein TonB